MATARVTATAMEMAIANGNGDCNGQWQWLQQWPKVTAMVITDDNGNSNC
jgi:hypothetical protein